MKCVAPFSFFPQQFQASSPSCVKEQTKKCCRFIDSLLYTARSRLHCEISSDCVVGTHEINRFEQQKGELSPVLSRVATKNPEFRAIEDLLSQQTEKVAFSRHKKSVL
jgi:hypothetical protein